MELASQYLRLAIKGYVHWTLVLHQDQCPFVGRCYAWWNDAEFGEGEGLAPSIVQPEANEELFRRIFPDVLDACQALGHNIDAYGKEFLLNTCYLANEPSHRHHLHWHFIPRFAKPVTVKPLGIRIADPVWGANYKSPYGVPMETSDLLRKPETLESIRAVMAVSIRGQC